ncbi:MAG: hypothetical protein KDC87_18460 [Planctomycetes bacterium]|nr:hypothetical protein [Planctomycetota bacterium]MCB9872127.1 hypothetical protein [Planctomycetota bacterium]
MTAPHDLDFTAVRYVTGELDAAEVSAFEARLGEDQAARDAVSRAVFWATAAVQEHADDRLVARPTERARPRRLVGAAAAAALVLVAAGAYATWRLLGSRPAPGAGVVDRARTEPATNADRAQALVLRWVELGEATEASLPGEFTAPGNGSLAADAELALDSSEPPSEDLAAAPSWLMKALAEK